jgi:putative colanic acid biosynthesis UDP-glucose lipid carrier transferase
MSAATPLKPKAQADVFDLGRERTARLRGPAAHATTTVVAHGGFPIGKRFFQRWKSRRPVDQALRALDILIAGTALVLLAPCLALVAVLIRATSPGPALFKQERHGLFGKRFEILKFRTMHTDLAVQHGVQTARQDPRITVIGQFLRRTSIDELPQLINVLRGDMSLVGPRPLPIALDHEVGGQLPYYGLRFFVRPGITGLAQARGFRGAILSDTALRDRTVLDTLYMRQRSLRLYLSTLVSTAAVFLFQSDAY